jgi:succinoglycan biosynthesis transport protein ExoP
MKEFEYSENGHHAPGGTRSSLNGHGLSSEPGYELTNSRQSVERERRKLPSADVHLDAFMPSRPRQGADGEPEFQLASVWRILRRHTFLILGLTLLGAVLGVVFSLLSPRLYTATATIEVSRQGESSLAASSLAGVRENFANNDEMDASMLTEQSELGDATVGLRVIDALNLGSAPPYSSIRVKEGTPNAEHLRREQMLGLFESRLKVALVKDTKLITVTFSDGSPQRAALVANTVIKTFLELHSKARSEASAQSSAALATQLADLRGQVLASEKRVSDYKAKTGIMGESPSENGSVSLTPSADSVVVNRFIELNRNLTAAEVSLEQRAAILRIASAQSPEVVLAAFSALPAGGGEGVAPAGIDQSDLNLLSSVRLLRSQLAARMASRSDLLGDKNPEMIDLRAEIKELDAQAAAELLRIRTRAQNEYLLAQENENGLRRLVAAQQQQVDQLNIGSNQLLVLEQEANSKRVLYQDLYAKLEQANVSNGIEASGIYVVDPARAPIAPSSPKTVRNVATGLVAGFLLGIFGAFLLDYTDDRLFTQQEVQNDAGLLVLASVFLSPATYELTERPVILDRPESAAAEAFRGLRSNLLQIFAPKRILFASADDGDETAAVGLNTAIAFSLQGFRVLLVEANLRQPCLQRIANLAVSAGLSEVLQGKVNADDAIVAYPAAPRLHLLAAGSPVPLPSEQLGSPRFAELLDSLQEQFDYVLITSPPALAVSDVLSLAPHVDTAVLVVSAGRTTKQMLRQTLAKLTRFPVSLVYCEREASVVQGTERVQGSEVYVPSTT